MKKVADHISTEYSRTAVIAHIGQATTGQQEGWGVPGTVWADRHFRTVIVATLADMRECSTSIFSMFPLRGAYAAVPCFRFIR